MSEIMKPNFLQTVFSSIQLKCSRYIIGTHELSRLVEANVVQIISAVGSV